MAAIHTERLTKRYGHATALDSLDLEIEVGEVFGYLGPNGAGKSTTIALLLDLIRPTSGSARIFGLDTRRDAAAIHRRLAFVPSEASLWPSLTGAETLRFLGNIHGSVDATYRWVTMSRHSRPSSSIRAIPCTWPATRRNRLRRSSTTCSGSSMTVSSTGVPSRTPVTN